MGKYNGRSSFADFDRRFERQRKIFWVFFTVVLLGIAAIWSLMGFLVYSVATDPSGAATFVGKTATEVLAPVIEEIKK